MKGEADLGHWATREGHLERRRADITKQLVWREAARPEARGGLPWGRPSRETRIWRALGPARATWDAAGSDFQQEGFLLTCDISRMNT